MGASSESGFDTSYKEFPGLHPEAVRWGQAACVPQVPSSVVPPMHIVQTWEQRAVIFSLTHIPCEMMLLGSYLSVTSPITALPLTPAQCHGDLRGFYFLFY